MIGAPAVIPSPEQAVWFLGPFPVRAYALCILTGIVVAAVWTQKRLEKRGGGPGVVADVVVWAVPFGIVGGRLYHVVTSPDAYFGPGGHLADALKIWHGGLGIWGAVALGAVGVWIGCRRAGVPFLDMADSVAPPLLVAQAIGRLGNWFNNELYGAPTDVPWGLQIHRWDFAAGRAMVDAAGRPVVLGVFHPTFLYEALWCLTAAAVLVAVERHRPFGGALTRARGSLIALYLVLYPLGRGVVESLRIDEAHHVLGLRLNVWTSLVVLLTGVSLWVWLNRGGGSREHVPTGAGDGLRDGRDGKS